MSSSCPRLLPPLLLLLALGHAGAAPVRLAHGSHVHARGGGSNASASTAQEFLKVAWVGKCVLLLLAPAAVPFACHPSAVAHSDVVPATQSIRGCNVSTR